MPSPLIEGAQEEDLSPIACDAAGNAYVIPPGWQPTLDGLRDAVPIAAWKLALSDFRGVFPTDDDLQRAYENVEVKKALSEALRWERMEGLAEELGASPEARTGIAHESARARQKLMHEMERASGYAWFQWLDDEFAREVEGEDE